MKQGNELQIAMTVATAALGIDFVSGRALAAFYGQLGCASWLGVLAAALLFGFMTAFIAGQARRSGAGSVGEFFERLPGRGMGKWMRLLYGVIVLLAAGMLTASAGHLGALVLPVRCADLLGAAFTLAIAWTFALAGGGMLRSVGKILVFALGGFELALLFFAELSETPRYAIELRLQDNYFAALGFALLHTCACLCIVFGLLVKLSGGRVQTTKLGTWAGVLFGLLLGMGNAVLMNHDERLLALKLPFVALSADWGSAGFYISSGLSWLLCAFSLSGLFYGILPVRGRAKPLGK